MAKMCRILIFIVFSVGVVTSQNVGKRDKSCRNVVAELNKLQMGHINNCGNQLGLITTKDKIKKSTCILKCVLQSVGVMNLDGSVSVAKLNQYIDDHFPASLRPRAHATFTPCLKLVQPHPANGTAGVADEYCRSHESFTKCMTRSFLTLCQNKP